MGHHRDDDSSAAKTYITAALAVLAFTGLTILIVWAVLHPTKPTFTLKDATLSAFNLTSSNRHLTTSFHVTLSSRNPNRRIGVDYTRLRVHASYRNQPITEPAELPQVYLWPKDVTVWSPVLAGEDVTVSPSSVDDVGLDVRAGVMVVDVKVYGRVRWKVGVWLSRRYRLYVNCPVYLTSAARGGNGGGGGGWVAVIGDGGEFDQGCNVEVSA